VDLRYEDDEILTKTGESPVLTDANALFDAVNSIAVASKLYLNAAQPSKWTSSKTDCKFWDRKCAGNSNQQLADGLTKRQVREQFAYLLRRGIHRLVYDGDFYRESKV
jgi:hypothetical protein